jgi:hypothetical protein
LRLPAAPCSSALSVALSSIFQLHYHPTDFIQQFDFTMAGNDTSADKAQKRKRSQETLKWGSGKHSIVINPDVF